MRKAILLASILALSLAFAATAYAADGSTLPHGGFSTSSDSCLQCHDIHGVMFSCCKSLCTKQCL